jgi:hypothetical protein
MDGWRKLPCLRSGLLLFMTFLTIPSYCLGCSISYRDNEYKIIYLLKQIKARRLWEKMILKAMHQHLQVIMLDASALFYNLKVPTTTYTSGNCRCSRRSSLGGSLKLSLGVLTCRQTRPHLPPAVRLHLRPTSGVYVATYYSSLDGRRTKWPIDEPSRQAKSAMRLPLAVLYSAAGLGQVQAHHSLRHSRSGHGELSTQRDSNMAPTKRVAIIGEAVPSKKLLQSLLQSLKYNTILRRWCGRNLCCIPSPQTRRLILHPA